MKTKIIAMLIALVVLAGVGSAALLSHYAELRGEAVDLRQSIVVDGEETNVMQSYEITNETTERIYRNSFLVENRAELPGYVEFVTEYSDGDAMTTRYFGTVYLCSKDGSWVCDGFMSGTLTYELNNEDGKFVFDFVATGLEEDVEYALIYYKDNVDGGTRFDPGVWGGDGGVVIATETATNGMLIMDNITLGSYPDIGMDLPTDGDWNIGDTYDVNWEKADYGQSDGFGMRTGAKVWLVPTDTMTDGDSLPVVVWAPNRFLFETDLINYDNVLVGEDGLRIGAYSNFELIIETEFEMDTIPGTYTVTTTIVPVVENI